MTNVTGNYLLLANNEELKENLSSVQIERTLDDLIFKALIPLIENTDYIEYVILELLPHIFLNERRKFSSRDREEVRDAIFSFVMTDNTQEKIKLLRKQTLERSVYFAALREFEFFANQYLENVRLKLHNKDVDTNARQFRETFFIHQNLYETCQSVIYWSKQAYKFRNMIVAKFIKHAYAQSVKITASTNLNISQDDLYRNLILVIHKALDKYDSNEGPLTNYINIWFRETINNKKNAHEEGVAFQMSTGQRKKMLEQGSIYTFTQKLDDVLAESLEDQDQDILQNIIRDEEDEILNNLTCRADPHKVFSLVTGVRYTLTSKDIRWQRESCSG